MGIQATSVRNSQRTQLLDNTTLLDTIPKAAFRC